jgi:hypothetical protein
MDIFEDNTTLVGLVRLLVDLRALLKEMGGNYFMKIG